MSSPDPSPDNAPSEKTIPDLLADLERSLVEAREARDRKCLACDGRGLVKPSRRGIHKGLVACPMCDGPEGWERIDPQTLIPPSKRSRTPFIAAEHVERRYDGRTEHADWCSDHRHDGKCLDVLLAKVDEADDE